jgi:hypothetical protein
MMVIIPHVMVEEPHKMAKALHILTEAPLEKTSHNLRQFWLSIHLCLEHYDFMNLDSACLFYMSIAMCFSHFSTF